MKPAFHTPELMARIHPALRQKYADMLRAWKHEVRGWQKYPGRVSTEKYDVEPQLVTGAFSPEEDGKLIAYFQHVKTKYLARTMGRTPESVSSRAHVLGLTKE